MKRMKEMRLLFVLAALFLGGALFSGCGSATKESGGEEDIVPLSQAATVGMDQCLTCHSPFSTLVQDYLVSRHGNHMLAAAKLPNDTETPGADPSPTSCAYECHDPFNDRDKIDLVEIQAAIVAFGNTAKASWTTAASIIGCEGCHGGGQYHRGVGPIPFPVPGPAQCGECHYLNDALAKAEWIDEGFYPHHADSSSGNNVRRNITDSHVDDPATADFIEGYAVRYDQQNGCVDCHFNGHKMDLTINYQWARSGHAGEIKEHKDAALVAGLPAAIDSATRLLLLADVAAAGSDGADYAWPHYDWDDRASRGSCQVCHTSTGISNFLSAPASYDTSGAGNNYSHLTGWTATQSSGQNELLYCWGCHSDSKGTLRNPGPIPLDYTYGGATVVLPEARKSNVCVKCHGGRGNVDSILASVAEADANLTDSINRSSRFSGHHAPTAGSMYAAQSHIAYEFTGQSYVSTNAHAGIDVGSTGRGPCVNCHLGGSTEATAAQKNHTFEATTHDVAGAITLIVHETTCNTAACHNSGMSVAVLQGRKDGFEAAKTVLNDVMKNTITNYLGLDIATTSNNNYRTVPFDAYGAFQNNIYMSEEPCSFVHNGLYAKRVLFDSIDFMLDGTLNGTIDLTGYGAAAAYLNGASPVDAVARP